MKIEKLDHIFFDLDHTLWDFDKNSALAFQLMFDKFEIQISIDQFLSVYQPINLRYWKLYREEQVTKTELRRGRLIEAFAVFGKQLSLEVIDALSDDYINFLPLNNYLIDGAKELLEYLMPKYKLHIITNGFREVQHTKLTNAKIKHYFKTVTNSEEVGVKKPNPIIFEHALKISGADVDRSLMIGDNYEADIIGAETLGIKTICFNYHQEQLPAKAIQVSALNQIKSYI
ncbi:noncanonical pyrimidine nucleotidase, YjjG family [Aquimarina sp. BL5]|uniref:YjjG family noncanonical pyrimidine nucleotidase n=1 Tax=Aquimarina sp. BL5 TaxID=1714860 RepID=UPI000E4E8CE5|nr:YjjG family noncanonical pyrimidine nucleotidase [Aquimarina sp. BL5]AXT52949.1 noncanonical pyrimidine nucleotidase, YjjG family [Aquimarina sp. BL5]RKN10361.1 noncanonical pyrimidine nucleotidase, YjjG family [Aquimarina sp. BL5]